MWMQLCSRAFIAGSNHSIPLTGEALDSSDRHSAFLKDDFKLRHSFRVDTNRSSPQLELQKVQASMLNIAHSFRVVHRPQLRKVYLFGCPLFHNCLSTAIPDKQFQYSDINDYIFHQALLADNVNKLTILQGSTDLFTTKVKSDEVSTKIVTKQLPVLADNFQSGELLKINELELLTLFEKPGLRLDSCKANASECGLYSDLNACRCNLCSKRMNALESSVSRAKQVVDRAVQSVGALPPPAAASTSHKGKSNFYLINLAHLLLLIACLRGVP
ncbi:uncharacterized protein LOC115565470 [Drosophila navojoa]|uniref:uncharacterized protein LOC115565470 n=1 Tax=Drosophila navojoa TaxID=7232 RepID=UPI000846296F|nr:uncharacterized protein LOC115565470 [Drosophila navojoa]